MTEENDDNIKKVYFYFLDSETGEPDYFWMEESACLEWEAAQDKAYKEMEERRKEAREREWEDLKFCRDD